MNSIAKEDLISISNNLIEEIESLRNSRILVTGATGFFGKWILSTIIYFNDNSNTNISIIAISRNPDKFLENINEFNRNDITFIKIDLKNLKSVNSEIDYIIHAGMDVSATLHNSSIDTIENEKVITDNILKIYHSNKVKKLLFTSSGAYYDKCFKDEKRPHEEFTPEQYSTEYGQAKFNSEQSIINANINFSIARCFAFIGPHLPLTGAYAAGNFINHILKEEDIIIKGNGTPIRSYLYMSDLIIYLFKMLCSKEKLILNIGSNKEISIKDLAYMISKHNTKSKVKVLSDKVEERTNCYSPNIDKLNETFNRVSEHVSLDEAIRKTITFYK